MNLKYYLLASEQNDYQPWITSKNALACFCLIIWALRLLLPVSITLAAPSIDPVDLMQRINGERIARFIPGLITNAKLAEAANIKSNDMLTHHYFAHLDPDGNYVWPTIERTGYTPYLTLGENLAMDFFSAQAVVNAWMNSPTHRANILNEKFQDQGLASVFGSFEPGHDTIMITNLFGTLLKKPSPAPATAPTIPKAPAKPTAITAPIISKAPTAVTTLPAPKPISINPDIKITKKIIADQAIVEVDIVISGNTNKVTAELKDKTVTLLPSAIIGQYLGVFTFASTTDFKNSQLTVAAYGNNGQKVSADFKVTAIAETPTRSVAVQNDVAGGAESQFLRVIKILFGIFAGAYMLFLAIDSIIIYRAKIKRVNIHSSNHALLFLLIALVNLLVGRLY